MSTLRTLEQLEEEASVFRAIVVMQLCGVDLKEAFQIVADTFLNYKDPETGNMIEFETVAPSERSSACNSLYSSFVPKVFDSVVGEGLSLFEFYMWSASTLSSVARLMRAGAHEEGIKEFLFYKILAVFVTAGVPILEALRVTGGECLSQYATDKIVESVCHGNTIAEGVSHSPSFFSQEDKFMLDIGEQTGAFDQMCEEIALLKVRTFIQNSRSEKRGFKYSVPLLTVDLLIEMKGLLTMVDAGLPLIRSLLVLNKIVPDEFRRVAYGGIYEEMFVSKSSFHDAILKYSAVFPKILVVCLGKYTGDTELLKKLVSYMEWELLDVQVPPLSA